jgi:hypothetical protein
MPPPYLWHYVRDVTIRDSRVKLYRKGDYLAPLLLELARGFPLINSLTLVDINWITLTGPSKSLLLASDSFRLTEHLTLSSAKFPSFQEFTSFVASFHALKGLYCPSWSMEIDGPEDIAGSTPPPLGLVKLQLGELHGSTKNMILQWLAKSHVPLQSAEITEICANEFPFVSAILGSSVRDVTFDVAYDVDSK